MGLLNPPSFTTLATIAGLQANLALFGPGIINVAGYAATNDGGQGQFIADYADGVSADNGGTIIVDGRGVRWKRQYSGALNVRWFGCKGDNATDDTTALGRVAAVANANNLSIYVPAGKYITTGTTTINITGNGTQLFGDGDASEFIRNTDSAGLALFYFTGGVGNNKVFNLKFTTPFNGTPTASSFNGPVVFRNIENAEAYNLTINGRFYVGVVFDGVTSGRMYGCSTKFIWNRAAYVYQACANVTVTANVLNMADEAGVPRAPGDGRYGVNTNPGGTVTQKNIVISDNIIYYATAHGISASERSDGIIITGNVVDITGCVQSWGIIGQAANGFNARNFNITGNTVIGGYNGVGITGADNFIVSDNLCTGQINAGHYVDTSTKFTMTGGMSKACSGFGGLYISGCSDFRMTGFASIDNSINGGQIINCTRFYLNSCEFSRTTGAPGNGLIIQGSTALPSSSGSVNDTVANNNAAVGIYLFASSALGVVGVVLRGTDTNSNATYGILSNGATDKIYVRGGAKAENNTTLNISLGGTNSNAYADTI